MTQIYSNKIDIFSKVKTIFLISLILTVAIIPNFNLSASADVGSQPSPTTSPSSSGQIANPGNASSGLQSTTLPAQATGAQSGQKTQTKLIPVVTHTTTVAQPSSTLGLAGAATATPVLQSISQNIGLLAGGTGIGLYGSNLASITTVTFGGVAATVNSVSANYINVTTPAGKAVGWVDIVISNGITTVTAPLAFRYGIAPTIALISPANGPKSGIGPITITGTGLTGANCVTFGSSCVGVNVVSDTQVVTSSPAVLTTGVVDVTLSTPLGSSTLPGAFTYNNLPAITGLNPWSVLNSGGQTITISGASFAGATSVTVNGVAASFTVVNDTQITLVAPAQSVLGSVPLVVTTPAGSSTVNVNYMPPVPTISSITPNSAIAGSNVSVTITGTNFVNGYDNVRIGNYGFGVNYISPTQLSLTIPGQYFLAGTYDVAVYNNMGQGSTLSAAFTFTPPPSPPATNTPVISYISPNVGPMAGGSTIYIVGSNLSSINSVLIGGIAAAISSIGSQAVAVVAPSSAVAGPVNVTISDGTHSVTANNAFTYTNPPVISTITPGAGPTSGGYFVTINGSGFLGTTCVQFGMMCGGFKIVSDTQILAYPPYVMTTGTVDVRVNTILGSATVVSGFTYNTSPFLSSVSNVSGPLSGGTYVALMGANLSGATSVTFGGLPATITQSSWNVIYVYTPATSIAGAVDIVVTTPAGVTTLTAGFTYAQTPILYGISQTTGSVLGGDTLFINGLNLQTATSVTFGGAAATIQSSSTNGIWVVTPPSATTGAVDVTVINPSGTAVLKSVFTYASIPPVITSLNPSSAYVGSYTGINIYGLYFGTVSSVQVGSDIATVVSQGSNYIYALFTPSTVGLQTVTVTTVNGTVTSPNSFNVSTLPTPIVNTFTPNTYSAAGGAIVNVTGSGLSQITGVLIGNNFAPVMNVTDTQFKFVVPISSIVGTVDVLLYNRGTPVKFAGAFTYTAVPAPTITSVTPSTISALGSDLVTVTGSGFTGLVPNSGNSLIKLGAGQATISSVTDTTITFNAPPSQYLGPADLIVTMPGGNSTTFTGAVTYIAGPTPTVTSLSSNTGSAAGGYQITINGTGFASVLPWYWPAVQAITLGGVKASFTTLSDTQILLTVPAQATTGVMDLVLITAWGGYTFSAIFTYTSPPAPIVNSLSQNTGSATGGYPISIQGANFTGASAVNFGSIGSKFQVISNTSIMAWVPLSTTIGAVDVSVVNAGGSGTLPSSFTYIAPPAPTISSLSQTTGSALGGYQISITGTNLETTRQVIIGNTPYAAFSVVSGTQLLVSIPGVNSPGTVSISVVTLGGTTTLTSSFTYTAPPPPTITTITPNTGAIVGGTLITISGTNFLGAFQVTIGGVAGTIVSGTATQLNVLTPVGARAGAASVVVSTPGSTATLTSGFTYQAVSLIPTFSSPVQTATGFTVNVTNYSTAYTFTVTTSAGTVTKGTVVGATLPLTVAGLTSGQSATITVTTTATGVSAAVGRISSSAIAGAALSSTFSAPVANATGFTVNIINYNSAFTYTITTNFGRVTRGSASGTTLPLTITGLTGGQSAVVSVTTTRTGYTNGLSSVTGAASLGAALTSVFSGVTKVAGGFQVTVTNYNSSFTYAFSTTAGAVKTGLTSRTTLQLIVSGLTPLQSATITVSTTRTGYANGTGIVTGSSL